MMEVDAQIAGRQPLVPIAVAREFIPSHGAQALRDFLMERGGRIAKAGSEATAADLRALGKQLRPKRVLHVADSHVAASALVENVPVYTFDKKFYKYLVAIGQKTEM
ncbi:MAG TPA: hypothetical protein VHC20_00005 [Candidatus Paceibacterota bacterium]|nr:hypothetical protein [Candidatus Paceibacterota bacterium]